MLLRPEISPTRLFGTRNFHSRIMDSHVAVDSSALLGGDGDTHTSLVGSQNASGASSLITSDSTNILQIQKVGEALFLGALLVALLQAMFALLSYRTNPSGELIVPPGLTYGVEEPDKDRTPEDYFTQQSTHRTQGSSSIPNSTRLSASDDDDAASPNVYVQAMQRFSRWMVVLIPWASTKLGTLLTRNTHIFHLGFIITLAQVFDIPNRFLVRKGISTAEEEREPSSSSTDVAIKSPPKSIIVMGDSLAVGLGSVNKFDKDKDNSIPFYRIENTSTHGEGLGPVFPSFLAQKLAQTTQKPVQWRSAGVDGGDTQLVTDYCLDIVKEECEKGNIPDIVVIIVGINDLKYFVANPFQSAGPKGFRRRLSRLIEEVRRYAPQSTVILPSLATQMFHRNSPLNIFPLAFFLDAVVGFWDSQKKLVADRFPSKQVQYVGLTPNEILRWYQSSENHGQALIADDGVHPNAACYAFWASSLGEKIAMSLQVDV